MGRRGKKSVSSSHFVGYVEDEESVESILKKFEELDKYQKEIGIVNEISNEEEKKPLMDEKQLEEVFNRTSYFTVDDYMGQNKKRLRDHDYDLHEEELFYMDYYQSEEEWESESEDEIFDVSLSEGDDDDFFQPQAERPNKTKPRSTKQEGKKRERKKLFPIRMPDPTSSSNKKISKVFDPSLPTSVRVPNEVKRSWGSIIQPYSEKDLSPPLSRIIECPNILNLNLQTLGKKYQAVYMDPPILRPGEDPVEGKITLDQLRSLKISSIIDAGLLFVWVAKENIYEMLKIGDSWGFRYVENFCWVRKRTNNQFFIETGTFFNSTKLTMLVMRTKGGDLELRHQRNPDCIYDFVKPRQKDELTERKPDFVYEVIETLLPGAIYNPETKSGGLLVELWARKECHPRAGWTAITQNLTTN